MLFFALTDHLGKYTCALSEQQMPDREREQANDTANSKQCRRNLC
jgi:hypothetical protein